MPSSFHPTCVRALLLATVFACATAVAQEPPAVTAAATGETPMMETVLVTGEQPGPGLWKISKDDHVLWILGTWSPLPRGMTWRSREAEQLISQSQEVLATPRPNVEISWFRKLTLLPAVLGARKNPDGEKLKDVLPPDLYARWLEQKERFIGKDNGIESRRPMLAAFELYRKAIRKSGLTEKNDALEVIEKIAKEHSVKFTTLKVDIPVDDPRQAIRDFEGTPREADIACLRATMDRLDTDLDAMRQRANAWASGDLEGLRNLPYTDQTQTCIGAVASSPALRQRFDEARKLMADAWIRNAEAALARNASTFAVLPMDVLTKNDEWIDTMRGKGYTVEVPQ